MVGLAILAFNFCVDCRLGEEKQQRCVDVEAQLRVELSRAAHFGLAAEALEQLRTARDRNRQERRSGWLL